MEEKKKKCYTCKEDKLISEFYENKNSKDGLFYQCKLCHSEANRKRYENDPEQGKRRAKEHRLKNPDYHYRYNKKYSSENREELKKKSKLYYEKYSGVLRSKTRDYYENNKNYIAEWQKKYREENRDKLNLYRKNRMFTDPLFKLKQTLRVRTCFYFKKKEFVKKNRTEQILGIDYKSAMKYMEDKFEEGMTWENHGRWHIDHIIPLYTAETEGELISLCHYSNLQPLWEKDNLSKDKKPRII